MNNHESTIRIVTRRRLYLTLFIAIGLLASTSGTAEVAQLSVEEHQITVASGDETTPTLGNDGVSDLVVYSYHVILPDGNPTPADIWYQRLTSDGAPTGPAMQVTADLTDDQLNDVSGDYIVYTAYDSVTSSSGAIMLYRISTDERWELARPYVPREARIYGNNVVWVQGAVGTTQVMWYELGWLGDPTKEARVVAGPVPPAEQVAIGQSFIAWTQWTGGQADIWAFDLSGAVRLQVIGTIGFDETEPATSGDWIVWETRQKGAAQTSIDALNPKTYEARTIADNGFLNRLPSMDGNLIAWDSTVTGNYDIFLYRLSDGQTFQVTTDPAAQHINDVFGNKVAWVDLRDVTEHKDIYVASFNRSPLADAGPDQSVILLGSTVQLDGSTSYDPDGNAITFLWSFTSRPGGSASVLSDPAAAKPTFIADVYGQYELSLTVTDAFGANTSDAVTVSFENVRPVANAGVNQAVVAPSTVQLDGTASSDANGDPLIYQWSIVSRPAGSSAVLSGETTAQPTFIADLAGQYVVSLTVSDGLLTSDPSNVTITATPGNEAVINVLRESVNVINGLAPASFKNPNMTNALTNKIAALIQLIEQGNYAEALDKVSNDILPKTNGCATTGAPDKNDWITDCAAQAQVYPYLIEVMTLLQQMMP